ncbi:hypothetical protein DL96DRAFT_1522630 [Flagelloscypha sp. PMI_526]|nr:hypothetical protein DL96DRAFT_1522630 [Flagelloscypha sp. PMI_526]
MRNFVDIAKELIENNPRTLQERSRNYPWPPLHSASMSGHVEVAKLLVEKGANIKDKYRINHEMLTPFQTACAKGHLALVRHFFESCDEITNEDLPDALRVALKNGRAKVVEYFKPRVDLDESSVKLAWLHGHRQLAAKIVEYMRTGNLDVSSLLNDKIEVPNRGIHVLSLEAGDTGLSTLFILQELMERMTKDLENDVGTRFDLQPSDVFDLIAGSGTGGIAALLVGRLGLSVADAIEVYCGRLAPILFGPLPASADDKQAATLDLEATMQKIVKDFGKREDLRLQEPASQVRSCKTFVLTHTPIHLNPGLPLRLRTYKSQNQSPNVMIWQAMRATTSNRNRFSDVEVDDPVGNYSNRAFYVGTDYGSGNPIKALLDETGTLFRGQKVASVTSIGAGRRNVITMQDESHSNPLETMFQMARDCDRDADEVAERFRDESKLNRDNPYARLSVEQGIQTAGALDNGAILAHTNSYLISRETSLNLDTIVDRILRPR